MKFYNSAITERVNRLFNPKGEQLGNDIEGPYAVIPLEPILRICKRATRNTTGAATVYTTPTDKDFYLSGFTVSYEADAACDTTAIDMRTTVEGNTVYIIELAKLTLTAGRETVPVTLRFPIKIDRGANITLNSSFTVGNIRFTAQIFGYTEEVTKT